MNTSSTSSSAEASANADDRPPALPAATVCVAVLLSAYGESDSVFKETEEQYESVPPPGLFFAPLWPPAQYPNLKPDDTGARYHFETIPIHKRTAYSQIRDAVQSGKYDCFFNLCDGGRDEDRAGIDVVHALEEFGVPFTGAAAKYYEPTKPDMKRIAHQHGVRSARGCVVYCPAQISTACARLRFPVIVKHVSGYGSVGMTRDAKCKDLSSLVVFASSFIEQFGCALVEEFIDGPEVTVLACADPTSPDGVKVYPPVMMRMPQGEDFKHFDLKFTIAATDGDDTTGDSAMCYCRVPESDAVYRRLLEVGSVAFKSILGGIGYGRSDLRIDVNTGEVYFLEINPNCGILYPYGEEGCSDSILRFYKPDGVGHREFIALQIETAIAHANARKRAVRVDLDIESDDYVLVADRHLEAGCEISAVKPLSDAATNLWMSATWDLSARLAFGTRDEWGFLLPSCGDTPNAVVLPGGKLRIVRAIREGSPITVDYEASGIDGLPEPLPVPEHILPSTPKSLVGRSISSNQPLDTLAAEQGSSCGGEAVA